MSAAASENIWLVTAIAGAENCAAVASPSSCSTAHCSKWPETPTHSSNTQAWRSRLRSTSPSQDAAVSLVREIRAALGRRQLEQQVAVRAATTALETNLRDTVAGLLLQSQLALAEPSVPPQLADKLKIMAELAGSLRQKLDPPSRQ